MTRRLLARENAELRAQLEALRQSEAIFKRLHQTRIDAFARTSLDGRIEEFNELFRQMVGYEAGELYGMHYQDLTPEKWHAVEAEIVEKDVLVNGQSELYEKEYRRKDGTVFPIEIRSFLIRHPADDAPSGMAAVVRDITRRKRGEQAIRESEEKFKTAFLTVVDACYIATLEEGTVVEVNHAFERMFGYSREEAVGRTSRQLGIWANYDERLRMREQVRSGGFVKEMETRGRRRNGEEFDCSVSNTAFYLQGRECVVGVLRDISDRKRAEQALIEGREALAESQEALLALINSTSDMIWSVDPDTFGLLTYNNALRDYFRRHEVQIRPGMTPSDLVPPQFARAWHEFYARALRDGPFVEQYFTESGLPVLLLSLNVVKRAGVVSAISVFGKDITERIVSEEALRRSERRFRTLIEDAPIAIRLARQGRTLYANRRYLDLYGYESASELLGRPIEEQWAPQSRPDIVERTRRFEAGVDVPTEYEGTAQRKDGTQFAAHASVAVVQLPDGPALIVYTLDITDRKRAEEALAHLSGRLIDAQEAERARVARELHDDFSQRLALVAVNLDLLRQSLAAGDDLVQAAVDNVHAQVQTLARDVRRMSHDLHPTRLEQLGLASALRGLCTEISTAHGLSVVCESRGVPRDLPDQVALCFYRVAQEALQNVTKHAAANAATVELAARDGELRLLIRDDGRGFDLAAAPRGAALGLANMRERVRSIGGQLIIETKPGGGTRVEVRAAVAPMDAAAG